MFWIILLGVFLVIFVVGLIHCKVKWDTNFDSEYWYSWVSIVLFCFIIIIASCGILFGAFEYKVYLPRDKQAIENKIKNIHKIEKRFRINNEIDIANNNYFDTLNKEKIDVVNLINNYNEVISYGKFYQNNSFWWISLNDFSKMEYLNVDMIYNNIE
jgi:hypothetical protein